MGEPESVPVEPSTEGSAAEGAAADLTTPRPTLDTAIEIVRDATDFTSEYDRAVDLVEQTYLDKAMGALRESKPDEVIEHLNAADLLRDEYAELLEAAQANLDHPLQGEFEDLREFAAMQRSLAKWLRQLAVALTTFRAGEWESALQTLNQSNVTASSPLANPELMSFIAIVIGATGEMLAAEIRSAVQDYAGARAAFDRSASLFQSGRNLLLEGDPDADPPQHPHLLAEAGSLRAQLAQLLQANDYKSAAPMAEAASEAYFTAAAQMTEEDPLSRTLLVPFFRSQGEEHLAKAEECNAEIALEDGYWDDATDHSERASGHYDAASKECLGSTLPYARVAQEKMLNAGFNWGVQFRRRLEREQQARQRLDEAQREVKKLYASVRSALAPTGVTVNTNTELVNSVHQQVEMVARVETQTRAVLNEVPAAIEALDVSDQAKQDVKEEARELAASKESGATFLQKVGGFASKLQSLIVKTGETAGPLVEIVKALSLLV